jgi:hypothetical protein
MTPQLRDHFTDALVAVCRLELENRDLRAQEPRSSSKVELISMLELERRVNEQPYEHAISDPIWFAARSGVKRIGKAIHREAGFDAMQEILYAAADQLGEEGQVLTFVDHAWSGIGEWQA